MFYNARWYDPALGRFAQAYTIIPEGQGVQAYDRFAYTSNNPLRYTDPTGHRNCEEDGYCPENWGSPAGWANPFNYPILSGGVVFNIKSIPGAEVALVAHFNWGAIKDAVTENDLSHLEDADFSLNVEATITGGFSEELDGEIFFEGSNAPTVKDKSGLSLISLKNVPVNVGSCIPTGVCGKVTTEIDLKNKTVNSVGYQAGIGQGVDLSVSVFTLSFPVFTGNIFTNKSKGPSWDDFMDEVVKDLKEYGE